MRSAKMIRSRLGRFVPVGPRDSLALLLILAVPTGAFAQTADDRQGQLQFKLSGFENLVGGSASEGKGGAAGGSSESEIELTPQYKTTDGTVFAARGVLNLVASSNIGGSSSAWNLAVPELSFFTIGDFGRIEIGDRSGFPQSLIGYTPSEIAFTGAEFGPESGERLDPNGGLPTAFLPNSLARYIALSAFRMSVAPSRPSRGNMLMPTLAEMNNS